MRTNSDQTGPGPERNALDQLGDLFFSSPKGGQSDSQRPQGPNSSKVRDLLTGATAAGQRNGPRELDPQAPSPVPVTAILAGGLPPERRVDLARRAALRLARRHGRTALLTFADRGVSVRTIERAETAEARPAAGRRLESFLGAVDQVMIILTDGAASYLEAGRRLPDHCIVLATPDPESLVEAYRELKTATAATTGPMPDLFILEADSRTMAERTYRRLARVAISHLGCTPTFAGQLAGSQTPPEQTTAPDFDCLDAETAWRSLAPLLGPSDQDRPPKPAEPPKPAKPPSPDVQPHQAPTGQRQTLPLVAGVVNLESHRTMGGVFTVWRPESRDQLLAAVNGAMSALLPGPRGVVNLNGEVAAAECPDLVAVDRDGRPIAILVSDSDDPAVLSRAIESGQWLSDHAGLLSRAFPEAGLDASLPCGECLVVVPESRAAATAVLCPPGVQVAGYLPVACGSVRGLLLRRVAPAGRMAGAEPGANQIPQAGEPAAEPTWNISPATVAESALPQPGNEPPAKKTTAAARDEPSLGTSPDDDLSADELSDLRTSFEIDELT
ncbi:MAG: hypothetical protein GWP05_02365 [Anaerolineaceae bacterium]|nr:hypothetical protein [Anaerolineaceae bacterium]